MCTCSNNCDDTDMLRQMQMLYCRSNRLVRLFSKCSKPVLLELCRSFALCFTVRISAYFGQILSLCKHR